MAVKCPRCRAENPPDSKFCKECAAPLTRGAGAPAPPAGQTKTIETPREELSTGTLFASRYQIVEELGGGGMGRVYRALDTKVGEEVAVKVIKPEIAAEKNTVERFKNELKAARKIVHKSVGRVYDLNEERGTFYITLEYVRGEDLKAFIRSSGQMAVGTSVRVARQIAEGLAEAHRLGIVHRDLKPSNIMIDRDGNARIMDFGIARLAGARGITGGNVIVGTPEYMSPEQVDGREAGPPSDLYSLGVVLFEMLTGRPPFEGESSLSVALKQKSEKPPDPRRLNAQIPEALHRVILKCLEKSLDKRYRTADDLLADLAAVEKSLPETTHPLPVRKPATSKEITVRLPAKRIWIPAAAALVAVAAFLVWQFIPEKEGAKRTVAVVGFKNQTGETALDYLREAIPHLLITSLEQSRRLRVTSWERMKDLLRNSGRDAAAIFDEEAAFDACRKEGIEALVLGSFVKAGSTFATDVQVLDVATKHILKSASARGDGIDSILRSQIDDISRTIRRGVGLAPLKIEAPARKIIDLTTSSMEAYNYYLKAKEADDNFFWAEGRKWAEKAVAVDPTFAIAYFLLSVEAAQLLDYPVRDEALEKAKIHSAKATEKERLFIEARYAAVIERDAAKRFRVLRELVEKYPEDKQARYELGQYFYVNESYREAAAEYAAAAAIDPRYTPAYNMLGYSYSGLGDFAKAAEYFERYARLVPNLPNPVDSAAEMYLQMGNLDQAAAKYKAALAIEPGFYHSCIGLAYVSALKEDYGEVGRRLEEAVRKAPIPQAKLEGLYLINFYDYLLGRLDRSLANLADLRAQAGKYGFDLGVAAADSLMGFMYADLGEADKARRAFESWEEYMVKAEPGLRDIRAGVRALLAGWVEIRQGRADAAKARLAEIEKLLPGTAEGAPQPFGFLLPLVGAEASLSGGAADEAARIAERIDFGALRTVNTPNMVAYNLPFLKDVLARARWKKGELDKAAAEYARLTTIDPGNRRRMLIPPLYHYRYGRVLEERGDKAGARREYEKFLRFWAGADPRFTELADARTRLAALRRAP